MWCHEHVTWRSVLIRRSAVTQSEEALAKCIRLAGCFAGIWRGENDSEWSRFSYVVYVSWVSFSTRDTPAWKSGRLVDARMVDCGCRTGTQRVRAADGACDALCHTYCKKTRELRRVVGFWTFKIRKRFEHVYRSRCERLGVICFLFADQNLNTSNEIGSGRSESASIWGDSP